MYRMALHCTSSPSSGVSWSFHQPCPHLHGNYYVLCANQWPTFWTDSRAQRYPTRMPFIPIHFRPCNQWTIHLSPTGSAGQSSFLHQTWPGLPPIHSLLRRWPHHLSHSRPTTSSAHSKHPTQLLQFLWPNSELEQIKYPFQQTCRPTNQGHQ
jgi:hypothetical protein